MFKEDKERFREWLINQKGLSAKASGDIICRCNRLNGEVIKSIDVSVSTPELYLCALKDIQAYATSNKESKRAQYTLTGTLRAAMKKYCEYTDPVNIELYPNGNSILR